MIAYLSIDPANTELFEQLAEQRGREFMTLEPREGVPPRTAVVLLDWDLLPPTWRQDAVKRLRSGPAPLSVAVHSYHVPDRELEALRQLGVVVYRTLHDAV
jgi:hypothetical protein